MAQQKTQSEIITPEICASGVDYLAGSTTIIRDFSADILPGTVTHLIGETASGRTTAALLLAGLLPAALGRVITNSRMPRRFIEYFEGSNSGYLSPATRPLYFFQDPSATLLFPAVADEIASWSHNSESSDADILREVGLPPHLCQAEIHTLSGGERQRLSLAALTFLSPDLIVLDDATGWLDQQGRALAIQLLERSLTAGAAVLEIGESELLMPSQRIRLPSRSQRTADVSGLRRLLGFCKPIKGVLQLDEVSVAYGPRTPLFDRYSQDFLGGRRYGLSGSNGTGKTTLAKILAGWIQPDSGDIRFGSLLLRHRHDFRSRVGYVSQFPSQQLKGATVHEFLRRSVPPELAVVLERFAGSVDSVLPYQPTWQLSTFQQRLLVLAVELARAPSFMVLDEPSAGQDKWETETLIRVLQASLTPEQGMIIVSHDREFLSQTCDEVVTLGPNPYANE